MDVFAFARLWQETADAELQAHGELTVQWVKRIALHVDMSSKEAGDLEKAAEFHDIGKLFVPNTIVQKTGRLGYVESEAMRMHALMGSRLFAFPETEGIGQLIKWHHEWWNGNGYPDHLIGEEIPVPVRVLSVADGISAMQANRPYKEQLTTEQIVAQLNKWAGTQFDPVIAGVAISILTEKKPSANLL